MERAFSFDIAGDSSLSTMGSAIKQPHSDGHVCFGSEADIGVEIRDVRFTPNNGSWAADPSLHLAVGL